MDEFDIISRLFGPLASHDAARSLADDAAVFDVPAGYHGVVSTDALVSGVHFPADASGDIVAQRALGCALSDLAAMGATPAGCLLTLGIGPSWDEPFLTQFSHSFGAGLTAFKVALWGGDTVYAPTPFVSICVHGVGEAAKVISRAGARSGDAVFVSGVIGDGYLGLKDYQNQETSADMTAYISPQPQLELGQVLAGVASACIDISDGLAADLDHICHASGVSMHIDAAAVPLSAAGHAFASNQTALATLLTSGDDYQLAFCVPPNDVVRVDAIARDTGVRITRIGTVIAPVSGGFTAHLLDDAGDEMTLANRGYRHF